MAAMPIMVDRHSDWMQLEFGCGSNQVDAGLAFEAYRLQSK